VITVTDYGDSALIWITVGGITVGGITVDYGGLR